VDVRVTDTLPGAAPAPLSAPRLRPLHLGPLSVDPPVVLAPMAGVTNPAFRALCARYGGGLYVSEMITARALVERNPRTFDMVARAPGESVHSVQLYGVHPRVMAAAVRCLVEEIGVDHIDLNFGCPAPKVTRRGGGAALPLHPLLFESVVAAAVGAAGRVPVTVKMRIGLDEVHTSATRAGRLAADAGAAAVALHARTAEQRYSGQARWEAIGELKAALPDVPVLGNGDIWEAGDALAMITATGCDGVVVGRGCLGRPWLFAELEAALAGRPVPPAPALGTVVEVMSTHAEMLCETLGPERGIRDFRKHTSWYLTGYPVGGEVRRRLSQVGSLDELRTITEALDPTAPLPEGCRRLARGHTDGPRPVALPHGWLDHPDDPTPPEGADLWTSGG
jgi:nifR3 family TIM-barrel protein